MASVATDAARLTVWALPASANPRDFSAWTPLSPRPVFGEFEGADQIACPQYTRAGSVELTFPKPDLFVAAAAKSKRKGRIYIDWQRNRKASTAIAPWSPRARPGATVACPVSWDELARTHSAAAYDLVRARRRLASLTRDPWHGYDTCRQTVPDL